MRRTVYSTRELSELDTLNAQAAVWVPVVTFAATGLTAVTVLVLAATVGADPQRNLGSNLLLLVLTAGVVAGGFAAVIRSHAYFEARRPIGRSVRVDVADAYETVRDALAVFVDLGEPAETLNRVADLVPHAEGCVEALHQLSGGAERDHPGYDALLTTAAEVSVLSDLAEERSGRRSSRRRDRDRAAHRRAAEYTLDQEALPSLADLATRYLVTTAGGLESEGGSKEETPQVD